MTRFAPPGFNEQRGELWADFASSRTIPAPDEFEYRMGVLFDLLKDSGLRPGVVAADERTALSAAHGYLNDALDAARSAGLDPDAPSSGARRAKGGRGSAGRAAR
jgi:hypothetical protein